MTTRQDVCAAMTVRDLIDYLQTQDQDAPVFFGCDYGDYHHTQQALPVCEVNEHESGDLRNGAYSQSGLALNKGDEETGSYCEQCDEEYDDVAICPKCHNQCVGEDGQPFGDSDEDTFSIVVLS